MSIPLQESIRARAYLSTPPPPVADNYYTPGSASAKSIRLGHRVFPLHARAQSAESPVAGPIQQGVVMILIPREAHRGGRVIIYSADSG